jgi:carbamoyltransferase
MSKTGYILGISRGHNAGVCLLKDGKIVFAIEEERFSRLKYDGGPYAGMMKVKEYTDKVDFIVVSHTNSLKESAGKVDFTGDDVYTGLARKLGLIDKKCDPRNHPQVIDLSHQHHKIHAACGFYRSGFDDAVAVIVDGAGSCVVADNRGQPAYFWEVETILDCSYPANFKTIYKHYGNREGIPFSKTDMSSEYLNEEGTFEALFSDRAGITKTYEAVTEYCGFSAIEAGKTMGLFPYGKENSKIPKLFNNVGGTSQYTFADRNFIIPTYPNSAFINVSMVEELQERTEDSDITELQNRRDLAYAVQTQTQEQVLNLIISASKKTGKKNVVLSGGYGLNCVANYYYLTKLNELGIKLYVEPVSNDGGTAIGVALLFYHSSENSMYKRKSEIYLGPKYNYTPEQLNDIVHVHEVEISDATDNDIIDLMVNKNIVAIFQGSSESGPRALGNRSLMFDPTFLDGKDYVNQVKNREYFRPFAGSILQEDVHEWFDLRGMESSPHMMYAVNCKPGVEEKIPSIIHVDHTCRIQTVTKEDNPLYHRLISEFKNRTGVPIVFNTSFNLGGDPLVETLDDAIDTLSKSEIEYLYLPEYNKLITVKNKNIIKMTS